MLRVWRVYGGPPCPEVVRSSLNRPNLRYEVLRRETLGEGEDRGTEAAAVAHLVALARAEREKSGRGGGGGGGGGGEDGGSGGEGGESGGVGIVYARLRDECERLAELLADAGMEAGTVHASHHSQASTGLCFKPLARQRPTAR